MNQKSCCEPGPACEKIPTGRRPPVEIAGWLIPGFILAILPKCPACLAAYVAIGTGLALSAPAAAVLRTTLMVLCIVSLFYLAMRRVARLMAGRTGVSRT
jgi:hypothetical protein